MYIFYAIHADTYVLKYCIHAATNGADHRDLLFHSIRDLRGVMPMQDLITAAFQVKLLFVTAESG